MAVDKLVDSAALDSGLRSVAIAIRSKGGTAGTLSFPSGMVNAINAIPGYEDVLIGRHLSGSYINNTISNIVYGQFCNMDGLTYVQLNSCKYIPDYAFYYCRYLADVSIAQCSYVQPYAFYHCDRLSRINMPLCTYVSDHSFYSCSSLSEVTMNNLRSIGQYAFDGCINLRNVNFPNVSFINNTYAFRDCKNLTTISFPKLSGLTYIDSVFSNCSNLRYAYFMSTSVVSLYSVYASSFFNNISKIYVPSSLLQAYRTTAAYSSISSKFVGL